jgi:hypothetical protein
MYWFRSKINESEFKEISGEVPSFSWMVALCLFKRGDNSFGTFCEQNRELHFFI